MSLLYVNPGYAELLDSNVFTTVKDNFTYSPLTGVSFTKTTYGAPVVGLPFKTYSQRTSPAEIHFYGQLKVYEDGTSTSAIMYFNFPAINKANQTTPNRLMIAKATNQWTLRSDTLQTVASLADSESNYAVNNLNKIRFHVCLRQSSTSKALMELWVNDSYLKAEPACFLPGTSSAATFQAAPDVSLTSVPYISDFILSDEEIPADAQVAILPASNIETNMASVEGGLYTPKSGDPTWLMTPNITPLLESHLSSSKVYGLAVGANPCQTTGTTTFTTLSKSGDTVTEHGTVTVTSADSGFSSGWITENTTLGDLANMQLGLKSGG